MTDIKTPRQMRIAAAEEAMRWQNGRARDIAAAIRSIPCAEDADVNALKAEVARLREAMEAVIARSHNDSLGTSKVIDMRRIACAALEGGKP